MDILLLGMMSRLFLFLSWGLLFVIALGVLTRAMDAGLACPDWPLCFGDIIPDYHPQVYLEFIHRAVAGIMGLVLIGLCGTLFLSKKLRESCSRAQLIVAVLSLLTLGFQVFLGWRTVVDLLEEKTVTAHLVFGFALFVMASWLARSLSQSPLQRQDLSFHMNLLNYVVFAFIFFQVVLGALVASHYAAVVCVDFPLCGGEFIPTLKGIIGLHILHRLGAYIVALLVLILFLTTRRFESSEWKTWVNHLSILVLLQLILGVANVIFYRPPLVTMFHSLVAALIVMSVVRLLYARRKAA